ncbi:hypothetical protein GXM_00872 [Nostoc sphaeroides CCNUC1]|uniref:Uncharacterized protein n=1 Tax=Nostoc sphaeroides CCNUC1 TaxID=2653204 RepID=A0A5P8VU11_9NOSO|nr:hypothetical protein GXM_00872 [Nostoc sphaeroides CCNUC1]
MNRRLYNHQLFRIDGDFSHFRDLKFSSKNLNQIVLPRFLFPNNSL